MVRRTKTQIDDEMENYPSTSHFCGYFKSILILQLCAMLVHCPPAPKNLIGKT